MIDNFAGKTAVLTGAGSGFGLECARIGARLGMNLVLVDVQQDELIAAMGVWSRGVESGFSDMVRVYGVGFVGSGAATSPAARWRSGSMRASSRRSKVRNCS